MSIYPKLKAKIETFIANNDQIPDLKQAIIRSIAYRIFITEKWGNELPLMFVCTHNSRRSHLSQVWAQLAAHYFQFNHIKTFSGGTEATAFYPSALHAIELAGFQIEQKTNTQNPVYHIAFSEDEPPLKVYSKRYDDVINPKSDFVAVVNCSQADESCPIIAGTKVRVKLLFKDPKYSDGHKDEQKVYQAKSDEIGLEIFALFLELNKLSQEL